MLRHGFVSDHSRKARAVRSLYDAVRQHAPSERLEPVEWETIEATDGVRVPIGDVHRVLNLRVQDEHMSPYFKTDMNLFQMLMLDESMEVTIYRAQHGWLLVLDGVTEGPKPFGQLGYDTR